MGYHDALPSVLLVIQSQSQNSVMPGTPPHTASACISRSVPV